MSGVIRSTEELERGRRRVAARAAAADRSGSRPDAASVVVGLHRRYGNRALANVVQRTRGRSRQARTGNWNAVSMHDFHYLDDFDQLDVAAERLDDDQQAYLYDRNTNAITYSQDAKPERRRGPKKASAPSAQESARRAEDATQKRELRAERSGARERERLAREARERNRLTEERERLDRDAVLWAVLKDKPVEARAAAWALETDDRDDPQYKSLLQNAISIHLAFTDKPEQRAFDQAFTAWRALMTWIRQRLEQHETTLARERAEREALKQAERSAARRERKAREAIEAERQRIAEVQAGAERQRQVREAAERADADNPADQLVAEGLQLQEDFELQEAVRTAEEWAAEQREKTKRKVKEVTPPEPKKAKAQPAPVRALPQMPYVFGPAATPAQAADCVTKHHMCDNALRIATAMHKSPESGKTPFTVRGETVYHCSEGSSRSNDPGTIFWINEGGAQVLVAIGHHAGTKGSDYQVDWVAPGLIKVSSVGLKTKNTNYHLRDAGS
jgi:hypothetical protein